jgi:xylulokinase
LIGGKQARVEQQALFGRHRRAVEVAVEVIVARDCLVGIDVGTTAVKAILIEMAGKQLANFTQRVAIGAGGYWHLFAGQHTCVRRRKWRAIDAGDDMAGHPLRAVGLALDTQVSAGQKTMWLGGPIPIDARHALSRIAYVARLHPDVHAETRHVLLPKDYCVM